MSFRSRPVGWRHESYRHYLAAKGISTSMRDTRFRSKLLDEEIEKRNYYVKKGEVIRDSETGLRFEWSGGHTVNVFDEAGVPIHAHSIGDFSTGEVDENDFKMSVDRFLRDRVYDEYLRGDEDVKRRYEDSLRKRSLRQAQGRGDR